MAALKKKSLNFIPIAYTFTELGGYEEKDNDFEFSQQLGEVKTELEEKIDYEILICQILYNLSKDEQMVFMFHILRSEGYNIDKESASKAMKISFDRFIYLSQKIKKKIKAIVENNINTLKKR